MSDLFEKHLKSLEQNNEPRSRAVIREIDCIGCTKCIDACPVDAILGASKKMHTVITDECTGCELCVAPCPVDCIDIIPFPEKDSDELRQQKISQFKSRYAAHEERIHQTQSHAERTRKTLEKTFTLEEKKSYVAAALLRTSHNKKNLF